MDEGSERTSFYDDPEKVSLEKQRQVISRHLMVLNSAKKNLSLIPRLVATSEELNDLAYITTKEELESELEKYNRLFKEVNQKRGQDDALDFPNRKIE